MYSRKGFKPRYKKIRYSNETTSINISSSLTENTTPTLPVYEGNKKGAILVSAASVQGTRKVKNMTLSLSTIGNQVPLLCTVVYVPQGTDPSDVQAASSSDRAGMSLYEPNQNVIMQFVINPVFTTGQGSETQVYRTRLARNLDSGDSIMLLFAPAYSLGTAQTVKVVGTFNYAISY